MPFYNGTLFHIDIEEMKRYAGMNPHSTDFPSSLIEDAALDALAMASPKGIWQLYPYNPEKGIVQGNAPLSLEGKAILTHLRNSAFVAVLAVTLGDAIEKASHTHFKEGAYVKGLLLDAAATAATEHIADQLDSYIQKKLAPYGHKTTWRFSPGYGDWPVKQQKELCHLIEAEKIGIRVTDFSMLYPRKSVSAIIGISSCAQPEKGRSCDHCQLLSCPFRNRSLSKGGSL